VRDLGRPNSLSRQEEVPWNDPNSILSFFFGRRARAHEIKFSSDFGHAYTTYSGLPSRMLGAFLALVFAPRLHSSRSTDVAKQVEQRCTVRAKQSKERSKQARTMTTVAPQEKQGSSSRSKGTFLCTAFVYVLLVSFVGAFFFMENQSSPSNNSNGDPDDSNGIQRVFNMAQSHFGNSIYQKETQKQEPADEETAIANAKEKQQQEEQHKQHSIISNDEDSNWPHWLGKYAFMPTPDEIDPSDRICYVHVGKTAGSTMACELGFAYEGKNNN